MKETAFNNSYGFHIRADYLLHAIFYIPLPLMVFISQWGRRAGRIPEILFSFMVVILFETVQILVPYRAFNINDLIANGVGVGIGLGLFAMIGKRLLRITALSD